MIKSIALWVEDDIEWVTPQEFDPPTPQDLERERQLSVAMNLWVEEYNDRMQSSREAWLNEGYIDHEGWGIYG